MASTRASLGAAADERKARLAKLKSLKRKISDNEDLQTSESSAPSPAGELDVTRKHLSGRNYDVESKGPKLGFENRPDLSAKTTLELQAIEVEHEIRKHNEEEQKDQGVDLFKLQPKKPNWDLKRDVDKLLEILNVRTENAIAQLVRKRIENNQASAAPVSVLTTQSPAEGDEIGFKGVELVEGVKMREKEDMFDQKISREEDIES